MVNYYANSTEVLGDNYSIISLECSAYNPNIDGTVTLTVKAKSVYGNPIEDMEIPVTCSDGNFTELNGSSITGASTVTGTTDSNGEFTLTYACSEWGLITFSANTTSTQIKVKGWRTVAYTTWYSLKTNGEFAQLTLSMDSRNISGEWSTILDITYSDYHPEKPVYVAGLNNALYRVTPSGNVAVARLSGSATTTYAHLEILWKLKE